MQLSGCGPSTSVPTNQTPVKTPRSRPLRQAGAEEPSRGNTVAETPAGSARACAWRGRRLGETCSSTVPPGCAAGGTGAESAATPALSGKSAGTATETPQGLHEGEMGDPPDRGPRVAPPGLRCPRPWTGRKKTGVTRRIGEKRGEWREICSRRRQNVLRAGCGNRQDTLWSGPLRLFLTPGVHSGGGRDRLFAGRPANSSEAVDRVGLSQPTGHRPRRPVSDHSARVSGQA